MKFKLDPANSQTLPKGRINEASPDAITENELVAQQASDQMAAQNAANHTAANRITPVNYLQSQQVALMIGGLNT